MRAYTVVDVFGAVPYAGNPVAVVLDGEGLSSEQMQGFAAWTNLSETTFVLPATVPEADYRVRIFTPVLELPFAGHPTLGTCHAWLQARSAQDGSRDPCGGEASVVQECAAGLVRLRVQPGQIAFAAPPLLREGPVRDEPLLEHIAEALRIERAAIVDAEWADNGPGWVVVMLEHAEAVLAMRPGYVDLDLGVVGPYPPGSPQAFEVRAFFPKDGTSVEDPVTGSLNAAIAPWLLRSGRAQSPYIVSQGTVLGRSGRVHVERDEDGAVWVGGATITCVVGQVDL
jgi:PhzF family phenazine biosynthesis protein